MRKIIAAVTVLSAMISCTAFYNDDIFAGYDDTGFEYLRYNDDIVRNCLVRPMILRGYVESLYGLENVKPADGTSYVFTDNSGQKIGPMKCSISGNDTTWTYLDYNFIVNRSANPDYEWTVSRNDEESFSQFNQFRYDFVLKVSGVEDNGLARVSLEGARYENSAYHLEYSTEGEFLMEPAITNENACTKNGILLLEFYKGDKKLDWLRTAFMPDGSSQFESTFD